MAQAGPWNETSCCREGGHLALNGVRAEAHQVRRRLELGLALAFVDYAGERTALLHHLHRQPGSGPKPGTHTMQQLALELLVSDQDSRAPVVQRDGSRELAESSA